MKMRALNHVNLVVTDIEVSARFYERVFGFETQWREGSFIFMRCGDTDFALSEGRPTFHRRFHIGFRLDSRDEVDSWHSHLDKQGVPIVHGVQDYGDYYTFSCADPDGHAIEIYHEPGERGRAGDVWAVDGE